MTQRVVFASGKGGTGKTTFTAIVAALASRERRVILADCDVEAANLPIALQAEETSSESFAGGSVAAVDPELCRGCGACVRACRFDALIPPERAIGSYTVDPWACEGCAACIRTCPYGALSMQAGAPGAIVSARSIVGDLVYGILGPGEDLSGKLVTEVRTHADEVGDGSEIQFIDGPPGVGCPVIASITNTDQLIAITEPTVSGEHDLMRLVTLARRLDVPIAAVINKADLSERGAAHLRERLAEEGVELIAEVPFDPALASTLSRFANGDDSAAAFSAESPGEIAASTVWDWVRTRLT